jgi:hypothetical protein
MESTQTHVDSSSMFSHSLTKSGRNFQSYSFMISILSCEIEKRSRRFALFHVGLVCGFVIAILWYLSYLITRIVRMVACNPIARKSKWY